MGNLCLCHECKTALHNKVPSCKKNRLCLNSLRDTDLEEDSNAPGDTGENEAGPQLHQLKALRAAQPGLENRWGGGHPKLRSWR